MCFKTNVFVWIVNWNDNCQTHDNRKCVCWIDNCQLEYNWKLVHTCQRDLYHLFVTTVTYGLPPGMPPRAGPNGALIWECGS